MPHSLGRGRLPGPMQPVPAGLQTTNAGHGIEQLDSVGIACMAKQHAIEAPVGANNKEDDS